MPPAAHGSRPIGWRSRPTMTAAHAADAGATTALTVVVGRSGVGAGAACRSSICSSWWRNAGHDAAARRLHGERPGCGAPAVRAGVRHGAPLGPDDDRRACGADAGELSARMGQDGVRLQQLALGQDPGPLVPDPDVPRFVERMELEWPIDTLEPLSFVLARLLDPLSVSLERADRGAAALRLDLRLVDRTVHGRVLQLPAAMRDCARAAHAADARPRIAPASAPPSTSSRSRSIRRRGA